VGYNADMNDGRFTRLEAQLERLIEGAFAQLFSKSIRPQDIALHLSRAMEDGIEIGADGDARPVAPDHYEIRIHPAVCGHLLHRAPDLGTILSQHMVNLATHAGYRLGSQPTVEIVADPVIAPNELVVEALHAASRFQQTARMDRIEHPLKPTRTPTNPQLIVNGQQTLHMDGQIINLGRSRDNQIVLDDLHVSRHHAQIRLRFGSYTLFDTASQSGTFVNDVQVREHRLQPGDVIRIGRTRLVYLEDPPPADPELGRTRSLDG
jgi:hypothetical protein